MCARPSQLMVARTQACTRGKKFILPAICTNARATLEFTSIYGGDKYYRSLEKRQRQQQQIRVGDRNPNAWRVFNEHADYRR